MSREFEFFLQDGFQKKAFHCDADIALLGGSAGGGKTYVLLFMLLFYAVQCPEYKGLVFRKKRFQLISPGGLWETCISMLNRSGIDYQKNNKELNIEIKGGGTLYFRHANFSLLDFEQMLKGQQFTHAFLDEVDGFSLEHVSYIISRLRSGSNIKKMIRLTSNPTDGWVKDLIKPFLTVDHLPCPEATKKEKYCVFVSNQVHVRNSRKALIDEFNVEDQMIQSLAFVPGYVNENKELLKTNKDYISKLKALPDHKRRQLLDGWWGHTPKIRLFQKKMFFSYNNAPDIGVTYVTTDTALKMKKRNDYTVFCAWRFVAPNNLYLLDILREKMPFPDIQKKLLAFCSLFKKIEGIYIEDISGGSALIQQLDQSEDNPYTIKPIRRRSTENKVDRAYKTCAWVKDHLSVHFPAEEDVSELVLHEICSFDTEMSHSYDDITDNLMDACRIAYTWIEKTNQENSQIILGSDLEMIGGAYD